MEDIKLWQLDGSRAKPLASNNRLESEQLLEETLVENPDLLVEGLTLVGRQTPTDGGPLDLLGVDADGRLAVFELKRGTLSRDAVAQIIDYASDLDDLELDALCDRIAEGSGAHGTKEIEDFQEWYGLQFGELESLKPLRLFLVGLGVDGRTERMVRFLANNSEMDISLLTFHGFEQDGCTLLAKQVEVKAGDDVRPTRHRRRWTKEQLKEVFNAKLGRSEVAGLFGDVKAAFEAGFPAARKSPNTRGLSWKLRSETGSGKKVSFARLDPERHEVLMIFYGRAIRLCREEFKQRVDTIPYQTWPKDQEPCSERPPEIQFNLTPEVWSTHKASLSTLVQSVYEALQSRLEEDGVQA